jgi:hypothetical protein
MRAIFLPQVDVEKALRFLTLYPYGGFGIIGSDPAVLRLLMIGAYLLCPPPPRPLPTSPPI